MPTPKHKFTWATAAVLAGIAGAMAGIALLDNAYSKDAPYRHALAQPIAPTTPARFDAPAPAPVPLVPIIPEADIGPFKGPDAAAPTAEPARSKRLANQVRR